VTRDLPDTALISSGGRVDFRLVSSSTQGANYEARWFLGTGEPVLGAIGISSSGPSDEPSAPVKTSWEITIQSPNPLPDWLESFSSNLLRTIARNAPPWPRRITRWRDER
jgi:hypothetical protein